MLTTFLVKMLTGQRLTFNLAKIPVGGDPHIDINAPHELVRFPLER